MLNTSPCESLVQCARVASTIEQLILSPSALLIPEFQPSPSLIAHPPPSCPSNAPRLQPFLAQYYFILILYLSSRGSGSRLREPFEQR